MIPLNANLSALTRSGIRKYTNLANEVPGCIKLTIGEPDCDTPAPIKEAAWRALRENQTHYAPNQGTPALRQAIAEWEGRRGYVCQPENILITAGATGALFTALLGILNPGDEVVIPTPAFPLYETIVRTAGAKPVFLDTKNDGFQLTKAGLDGVISEKTRAVILNSPNNPTGVVYTVASLTNVKQAILGRPITLVCDNVYQQLCNGACPDLSLDGELREQTLLCQSFSKPYAMTGWRVGYLAGPEAVIARLLLLAAAQVASIPTFLQTACITALDTDTRPMAEVYRVRREAACRRLERMGISYPTPGGAFYLFPNVEKFGLSSAEFCTRMIREARVAAVPGVCFGTEGHIRLSCACADEALEAGLDRMEKFLKTL